MNTRLISASLALLCFWPATGLTAPERARQNAAADMASAGRDLVVRHADTIVGVEMVVTVKVKSGDREMPPREQRVEVNGTVIAPNGLTVTSLADVDPQVLFESMRMRAQGPRIELLGVDFKQVKLRLADGTEVPARFVLKDADLDLAFMAPEDATKEGGTRQFAHVDLANPAEGAVLDEFFFVSRANKVLQRAPLVRSSRVMGLLEKPRRFYLMTELALGAPMFAPDGRVLGITLQHIANGRRNGMVVLPAADIAEIAAQVDFTKAEETALPAPDPTQQTPTDSTN